VRIRVWAKALEGMQKEALVSRSTGGHPWRFLCDEGPYLDGTDLAPPPLAYFAAGMAAHNAGLVAEEAASAGLDLGLWSYRQDTFYTMEGSALQGTMTGGALPVELRLQAAKLTEDQLQELVSAALRRSVAEALMASAFSGTFSVRHNGAPLSTGRVASASEPLPDFDQEWPTDGTPQSKLRDGPEIVQKAETVQSSDDATHGQGASLRESQKRRLHLKTLLQPREDGRLEMTVHLIRPLGSTFRFLASGPGAGANDSTAPDGLDYLAAGIALCFLTQMGRYAQITRCDLDGYGVVQDLEFSLDPAKIHSLVTHARVESGEDSETVRRYVDMSEQTCFLHASCRAGNPTQLKTEGNHEGISD